MRPGDVICPHCENLTVLPLDYSTEAWKIVVVCDYCGGRIDVELHPKFPRIRQLVRRVKNRIRAIAEAL